MLYQVHLAMNEVRTHNVFIMYWIITVDETRNLYWLSPLIFLAFKNKVITPQKKDNRMQTVNDEVGHWKTFFNTQMYIIFSSQKGHNCWQFCWKFNYILLYLIQGKVKKKKKLLVSRSRYNLSLIIYWSITS